MWRLRRSMPNTSYFAWNLIDCVREEEEEMRRDIKLRVILRKLVNPYNVCDKNFIKKYRLNKEAFDFLENVIIQRTNLRGTRRVSLKHKLLCALTFYKSGSYQQTVGEAKNMGQTTVSKYVKEVTDALSSPAVVEELIKFPTTRAERDLVREKFYIKYGFPGVIGCIDGSHFRIFTPKREVEHLFFCRKHYHSINVQMVCDSDACILNVNAKYGGPTHDAFIWENSEVNNFMQGLHSENEHTWLLGDSGYPLRPWLMIPFAENEVREGSPQQKYNEVHRNTRVIVENTFGRLKNRWRCVHRDRTMHYKPEKCAKIILACSVLHNLAIKFNVPDPDDSDDEDNGNRGEEFTRREVPNQNINRDQLNRGKVVRNQLVNRINMLH